MRTTRAFGAALAICLMTQALIMSTALQQHGVLGRPAIVVHTIFVAALALVVALPVYRFRAAISARPVLAFVIAATAGLLHALLLFVAVAQIAYLQREPMSLPVRAVLVDPPRLGKILEFLEVDPLALGVAVSASTVAIVTFYILIALAILHGQRPQASRPGTRSARPISSVTAGWCAALLILATTALVPALARREPFLRMLDSYDRMIPDAMLRPPRSQTTSPMAMRTNRPGRPRPIILIVVDALRADAVHRNMPRLSGMIRRGVFTEFQHAFSTCTYSACGILSILTGRYWDDFGTEPPTLPDMLARYGYQSHFVLSGDHTELVDLHRLYGGNLTSFSDGIAAGVGDDDDALLPRLRRLAIPAPESSFVYVHMISAHEGAHIPSYPAANTGLAAKLRLTLDPVGAQRAFRKRYAAGVRNADRVLANVLHELEQKRLLEDAVIIITADHGERLGPGGRLGHGGAPDLATLSVPLLIRLPKGETLDSGRVASSTDIVPTVFQAIRAELPLALPGTSLTEPDARRLPPIGTEGWFGHVAPQKEGISLVLQRR